MKIDVKTLEKLVWIIYKRFFIEKGKLKDIQIKIDQYIQIRMVLVYKGIETKIHIDADLMLMKILLLIVKEAYVMVF